MLGLCVKRNREGAKDAKLREEEIRIEFLRATSRPSRLRGELHFRPV
jgi:hypothetical protein